MFLGTYGYIIYLLLETWTVYDMMWCEADYLDTYLGRLGINV